MGKYRNNLERLLQAAYDFQNRKRALEISNSVPDKKSMPSKVFNVIEQPLVLGALFAVGGLVGALLFTPAFILCALCILFGVHRARALAGQSPIAQIIFYLALAVLLSVSGYFLYGALDKALVRSQTAFANRVADLVNYFPKESKQGEKIGRKPESAPAPSLTPQSAP